ncbi:hypothetical protein ASD24_23785 [Paenibacillus sp. Root52]|uniref:hypothetical protein n=1 Tax=Paenibacillus sp. Root52 TaxID=1736552 RepID=UPI0006FAA961|nr:hypothetical protein [Paenibacillus sp. Root52]KQY91142.1 hypothetical protein ASD24_23785 [Paenibacillus sp. Root52]
MEQQHKPIGIGTLALLVLTMGFAFNFPWGKEQFQVSYYLFQSLNWPIYSNGNQGVHLTFVAAIVFWVATVVIARKFHMNYGAKLAYRIGSFMLIFSVLIFPLYGVIWFIFGR